MQRNSGSNAEGARGDERNTNDATINLSGNATIHTSGRRGEGLARGAGEEGGGEQGDRRERRRRRREGEERHTLLRLLFLGGRGGEALASSSPLVEKEGWIGGDKEGEGGGGGNEGIGNTDDASEKDAAWSFVSFSSEKETKEPWPAPLLNL